MGEEWEKFRKKIGNIQSDLAPFEVEFLERHSFKVFVDYLSRDVQGLPEICITGCFSDIIQESLECLIRSGSNVSLICPEFQIQSERDKKNLQVLKKLAYEGAKIKINNRLHARFFVAYNPKLSELRGLLIIGSFDFNTEGIGKDRHDAGIKTKHPDLVKSAVKLFEQIWEEPDSVPLLEKYNIMEDECKA